MLESTTTTKYAVARRTTIISDGYDDVETAQRQLAHIQDTMTGVGLKPDVHVVEVEVETIVGKAHAWTPKADEPEEGPAEEDEQPSDPADGEPPAGDEPPTAA